MKKILSLFLLTGLVTASCKMSEPVSDENCSLTLLKGQLEAGDDRQLRIERVEPGGFHLTDNLTISKQGYFNHRFKVDSSGFYRIRTDENNFLTIICHGKDTVDISGNYNHISTASISGSEELEALTEINKIARIFAEEIGTIAKITRDSSKSENFNRIKTELDSLYDNSFRKLKSGFYGIIKSQPGSLVSYIALSYKPGENVSVFSLPADSSIYRLVLSSLKSAYPHSGYVEKLERDIELHELLVKKELPALKKGEEVPDIILKNPDNKTFNLSDFRGKYILINFWASWSPQSREENHYLRTLYRNLSKVEFEILQVSLDGKKEDWQEAINRDSLIWEHTSELKFWDSQLAELFGVERIPANIIISPNGIVLEKNIETAKLEKKLYTLISNNQK